MDRYGIICADGFLITDIFINLLDGKNLPRIHDQEAKDVVLHGSQLHRLPVNRHLLGIVVDAEPAGLVDGVAVFHGHGSQFRVPADMGLHPGHQLQWVERLVGKGIFLAVNSNKRTDYTEKLIDKLFGRIPFVGVFGERAWVPKKPDPAGALELC